MTKVKDRYILIIYLLVFFGIAATIAFLQPLTDGPPLYGNPPDETYRYMIPRFICEHGALPNGYDPEIRIPPYGISYAFYNIFPYIVQGYIMKFISLFSQAEIVLLYTARLVNVCFGTAMAAVVYGIGNRVFTDRRFKWLFCVLVMYLPQSLFIHTYVNTDSMCLLSTAIILYALIRAYQESFTTKNCLWLSAGIILCALSYYNAYGYILSSMLLFVVCFFYKEANSKKLCFNWKEMWKKGSFIAVIVLLGIGWYFIRNAVLYEGDFIGLNAMNQCAIKYAPPETNPLTANTYNAQGVSVFQMLGERDFFNGLFTSFVAAFGSMSIFGSRWMYRFYKALIFGGILLFVVLRGEKTEKGVMRGKKICFHANMVFCIIMPVLLLIYYAYFRDYQNQGRYVLPGIIPIMYYTTAGCQKLAAWKRIPKKLASVGVGCAIALVTGWLFWMVFHNALPVYLEIGRVL